MSSAVCNVLLRIFAVTLTFSPQSTEVVASTCLDGYCKNGGTCSVFLGKASCSCPSNFTGAICDRNVDECLVLSNPCKNGATCIDLYGSYVCHCINGWEGFDCSINKDDCLTEADASPLCLSGGTCVDRVGKYYCLCPPGRTGSVCQFIDACYSNPCHGSAACLRDPFGRYSCYCPKGWTGKNCSTDIDDCISRSRSPCHHGGTCVNTPGSFVCQCAPGYTGEKCELSVNECASNPCKNNAPCLDYINEFECICPLGWTGKTCDVDINECSSSPCKNEGQCVNELNSYRCKCKPAFNGTNCEINIDDCANPNPCQNGATCSDGLASYTCFCACGFTGKQCETNIDDCQSFPCQHYGTCVDGIDSYSCVCAPGYTGKSCDEDYDECSSTSGPETRSPFVIPDKSMTASSQKEQYPAHHGVFGRDSFWCSEEEKTSYLEIQFPMKYKITGARIQLKSKYRIKAIIFKVQLFDQWINYHQDKPPYSTSVKQIEPAKPFIAQSLRIRILRTSAMESICLRVGVLGCEVPKGCILQGSAVLIKRDGRYRRGYVGGIFYGWLEVFQFGQTKSTLKKAADLILDEKPNVHEITKGTLVLGADVHLPGLIREGKIEQVGASSCTIKTNDETWKSNLNDIRIVKISNLCPS